MIKQILATSYQAMNYPSAHLLLYIYSDCQVGMLYDDDTVHP
jgi:hypothetical protein